MELLNKELDILFDKISDGTKQGIKMRRIDSNKTKDVIDDELQSSDRSRLKQNSEFQKII